MERSRKSRAGRRALTALAAVGCLAALALAATAGATRFQAGKLIIDFNVDFAPRALPHVEDTGVTFTDDAKLSMTDGSYPPVATFLEAEFDKSGSVETRGLPVCPKGRLEATTPSQARRACPDALVGTGFGEGVVLFPEQAPIEASSAITFFNGPPIGGDPTLISHAYLSIPAPTAILIVFRIKEIKDDYFGTRIEADVPKIAGGNGSVTAFRFKLGHEWTYRGKRLDYLNAHCAIPGPHRLARARVKFSDGTDLSGSIFTSCSIRKD